MSCVILKKSTSVTCNCFRYSWFGRVMYSGSERRKCYVDHICVTDQARGKGVGKILLERAEYEARKRDCKVFINVDTRPGPSNIVLSSAQNRNTCRQRGCYRQLSVALNKVKNVQVTTLLLQGKQSISIKAILCCI